MAGFTTVMTTTMTETQVLPSLTLLTDAGVLFSIPLTATLLLLLPFSVPSCAVSWMLAVQPVTSSLEMLCKPLRSCARALRWTPDVSCLPPAPTTKPIL